MTKDAKVLEWTGEELKEARRTEVEIFFHGTSEEELTQTKGLPNDLHLVEYTLDGKTHYDGVRSYKMVSIFDLYYDKLTPLGGEILSIKSGYGNIKPKLFNAQKEKEKK